MDCLILTTIYEKNIKSEYLKEVQDGYFGFFKSQTELKILVIDTSDIDFVNKKTDYQQIKKIIFEGDFKPGMNMLIL